MKTMKADSKRRVILPGSKPGDIFAVRSHQGNEMVITKLEQPKPGNKPTKEQIEHALAQMHEGQTLSWEELRAMTREEE